MLQEEAEARAVDAAVVVRQLEDELGVQLLRRSTRRFDLTAAGEAYLARVRAILDAVDATYSLLPALARALRDELPGIDFGFRGEMPDQVTALRDEGLVVHAGRGRSAMHDAVVGLCRAAGFESRIRHQVAETSTLVTFVAAGLGVAVPEPVAELGVAGATYRPLVTRARMDLLAATRAEDDSAALARTLGVLRVQVGG